MVSQVNETLVVKNDINEIFKIKKHIHMNNIKKLACDYCECCIHLK
jgi:hypothetical protein